MPNAAVACSSDLDSPILNFCVVTPDVLWRGAQPAPDGAAWLMQRGVRTIVNLELLHDDRRVFRQARLANAGRYEVGYFHIPDWEPNALLAPALLDDHVAHFLAVVDDQPKPVYVHCRSGQNRTGVMVAAYRVIVEGAGADEAIEGMRRYRGIWFKADSGYIRGLSPERRGEIRRKAAAWVPKLERDSRIICENGKCGVSTR
jgi:protein tyrosine/serine phosphatase